MITIAQYEPTLHSIEELAYEQNKAVVAGEAKMLKWIYQDDRLHFSHDHPFFLAFAGTIAVGGAGYNMHYHGTNCLELGGAYISPGYRGMKIYHKLTEARIKYATDAHLDLITFANASSAPILTHDFGMIPAEHVPEQAFELCGGCEDNPNKPQPACIDTCCDHETILALPHVSTDVKVV